MMASSRYWQATPWLKAFVFRLRAFWANRLIKYGLPYLRKKQAEAWRARLPTRVFTYPCHPRLKVRLHNPTQKNYEIRKDEKTPIFFLIHGGGYVMGDGYMDDEQADILARDHGFCVLGLDYSLSPGSAFPKAIHELSDLINAVLEDKSLISELNLDTSRVAVGGFSAGGNMTLALAQLPKVGNKIHALVTFYPRTDFSRPAEQTLIPKVTPWGKPDPLPKSQPVFKWAYVPVGQDLHDPLLSPKYASRQQIPHPLFMITAEKDLVCEEGYELARKLAELDAANGDGNDGEDVTEAWSANGVRYVCAEGMPHCFTHDWEAVKGNEMWERKRREINARVWEDVGTWTRETLGHGRNLGKL